MNETEGSRSRFPWLVWASCWIWDLHGLGTLGRIKQKVMTH